VWSPQYAVAFVKNVPLHAEACVLSLELADTLRGGEIGRDQRVIGVELGPLDPLADGVVADAQPPGDRIDGVPLDDNLRGPRPS